MILDKKFNGILDQGKLSNVRIAGLFCPYSRSLLTLVWTCVVCAGSGALIAYEDTPDNTTLESGIEAIEQVFRF
jgi:hypothetical protein